MWNIFIFWNRNFPKLVSTFLTIGNTRKGLLGFNQSFNLNPDVIFPIFFGFIKYASNSKHPALNLELYYSLLFDQKVLWKVQAVFDAWHFNFSSKSKLLLSNNECLGLLLILMDTPLWLEPTARTAFIRETAVIRKKQCSEFFKSFLCTFINITFDNRKTMLRNQNVALIHACFFHSKIEKFVITHFLRLYKSRLIHVHSKYLCH